MLIKRHSTIRSPQLAKKRKKQLWIKMLLYVVFALILVSIPPLLSHIPALSIRHIDIVGSDVFSREEITSHIEDHISGSYARVFSKKNIFLYPRKELEETLLQDFSRLQTVSISFKNLHSITVGVREREPFAVWCKEESQCYFIDAKSFIFAHAPTFSGPLYVTYYGNVAAENPIGEYVVQNQDLFSDIHSFVLAVGKLGFFVERVLLTEDGDIELHTQHGGIIYITTRDNTDQIFQYLSSLVQDKITVPDVEDFAAHFTYIDLRFGKKIFLK